MIIQLKISSVVVVPKLRNAALEQEDLGLNPKLALIHRVILAITSILNPGFLVCKTRVLRFTSQDFCENKIKECESVYSKE